MITLTQEDIAEFQRLAAAEGKILTTEEASARATQVILLYQRLAMPTPSEVAVGLRRRRAETLVLLLETQAMRSYVKSLKRGGRDHHGAS